MVREAAQESGRDIALTKYRGVDTMSTARNRLGCSHLREALPRMAEGLYQHRLALLLLLLLNLADVITTHVGLAIGIPEGNPLPAMLLAGGGQLAMFASKAGMMAGMALIVCLLHDRYPNLRLALTVTNFMLLLVLISNSAQIMAIS